MMGIDIINKNVKKWTENRLLFCVKMENHKFTLSIVDYAVIYNRLQKVNCIQSIG